nr:hypothetical protein CFP56_48458 [Quercus suber]
MGFVDAENSYSKVIFEAQTLGFIEALTEEQPEKEDEKEGGESPSMVELVEQIDSHVVVIDVDNLATNIAFGGQNALEVNLTLTIPTSGEASSTSPAVAQGPAP